MRPLNTVRRTLPYATIFAAALLATLPLFLNGPSCGHDLTFHLLNWLDAAHQWRTGTLRPWWCFPAAWNTGEARYLFYPPLSWMLGAMLTLITGAARAPVAYTVLALTASGITMRRFLGQYVSRPVALLGGCLYLAHPYMLFTATERTAYAELLAAAWLPWLLQEALRSEGLRAIRLAVPVALLWLTNTPAAVLGTYALTVVLLVRLILNVRKSQPVSRTLLAPATHGYLLGLALSAWYLLPALVQHTAVEVGQAFTSGMQPEESTLFHRTGQPLHDAVVYQASVLAVILLVVAILAGACILVTQRRAQRFHGMREASLQHAHKTPPTGILLTLTALTLFLLTPGSLWIWHHAPELQFLQFPWRTLMLQGVVSVTLIVLAVRGSLRMRWAVLLSLVAAALVGFPAHHAYAQVCDSEDAPASVAAQYERGGGFEPYDEYTPADADNDLLHPDTPPAWTAAVATAPAAAGNATHILVTEYGSANRRIFSVQPAKDDRYLIVRQRRFRNWHVTVDDRPVQTEALRDDDLLAITLPDTSAHTMALEYRWSWDQVTGALLSAVMGLTLLLLALSHVEPRKRVHSPPVH